MEVNGGLIKEIVHFPDSIERIAVKGIWSGGQWAPEEELLAYQHRNQTYLGVWRVVGVDRMASDVLLILSPTQQNGSLTKDDILVFGEGLYTILEISETTLPSGKDCAIEFGHEHYHGIALLSRSQQPKLILFHPPGAKLPKGDMQSVWWRGQEFSVRIVSDDVESGEEATPSLESNHSRQYD